MAISDGMTVGWSSPMIPYFLSEQSHIQMTRSQAEWLETWLLIGSLAGIPPTIYFVDKIGRKKSLLLSSFALLLSWIGIGLSTRPEHIYVARVIAGMGGDMAFVAAPMYIAEMADQKIRGFLSSVIYLMMLTGVLLIYAVGPFLPFYVPCILGAALLTVELVVFSLLPETPYYLLLNGQHEEARHSLKRFRRDNFTEKELEEIRAAVDRHNREKGNIKMWDIFVVKNYRKALLIMIVLNTAQQLSSINVILMNMHEILYVSGSIYMKTSTAAILFAGLMFVAAVSASVSIDKFGRKKLMMLSSLATGVCLLALAIYFNIKHVGMEYQHLSWIPIASVMAYALVFKFGLGMVPIVITAEIFAHRVKALGMAIADGVYVLSAIVSLEIFNIMKDHIGMHVPFYVFSACSFLTMLFILFFVPETKGKSLDEIQLILSGELNKNQDTQER